MEHIFLKTIFFSIQNNKFLLSYITVSEALFMKVKNSGRSRGFYTLLKQSDNFFYSIRRTSVGKLKKNSLFLIV